MKIVFMGTPDFAVPCLERLIADGHEIVLVITQADKPKGRGHVMTPPPVKSLALTNGLSVFQPDSMKTDETFEYIRQYAFDLFVVVAYGKILPQRVLDLPRYGCINVHASLLPKYRGAAPVQWAVLNGDTEAGVTTMQMNAGIDTGDMLLTSRVAVSDTMTSGELFDRLSMEGAQVLSDTIHSLEEGTLVPIAQEDSQTSYAPMLDKSMSAIDWNKTAKQLHNQIRGLNPWPVASFVFEGKALKVYGSRLGIPCDAPPSTVVKLNPLTVACGEGTSLELLEVQYECSKRMSAQAFLRGHSMNIGDFL